MQAIHLLNLCFGLHFLVKKSFFCHFFDNYICDCLISRSCIACLFRFLSFLVSQTLHVPVHTSGSIKVQPCSLGSAHQKINLLAKNKCLEQVSSFSISEKRLQRNQSFQLCPTLACCRFFLSGRPGRERKKSLYRVPISTTASCMGQRNERSGNETVTSFTCLDTRMQLHGPKRATSSMVTLANLGNLPWLEGITGRTVALYFCLQPAYYSNMTVAVRRLIACHI